MGCENFLSLEKLGQCRVRFASLVEEALDLLTLINLLLIGVPTRNHLLGERDLIVGGGRLGLGFVHLFNYIRF
jgi:hypothetical protein